MIYTMNSAYYDMGTRSIADLVPISTGEILVTRINVPAEHRGKGIGSKLLRSIVADADIMGVTLILEPSPYGGLNYEQLTAWYKRYGFVERDDGMYTRQPVVSK